MAQSSAKSSEGDATVCRKEFGAQVVLLNATFAPADASHLFDHSAWNSSQPVSTGRGANWYV